jgi:hypothetical protein
MFGAGLVSLTLLAQIPAVRRHERVTYVYDLDGRPTAVARSSAEAVPGRAVRTETAASVNSRPVTLETVEERVIRQGPGERIVEIFIQRYDQDGRPTPPEKILREERTGPAGKRTEQTSVYRADLNGRFSLAERSVTTSSESGGRIRSETRIERPSIHGAFEVAERRLTAETRKDGEIYREVTIEQARPGSGFEVAAKEVTEIFRSEDREVTKTVRYNTAATGRLSLAAKTVREIERHPDGTETTLVSIYGVAPPGRPAGPAGEAYLREQQRIERTRGPGGAVIERFSVSRPSLADQRLGPFIPISEVVCKGDCEESSLAAKK